ncbi:DUF4148 domain-containing protein [Paraburkholderia fungorum]
MRQEIGKLMLATATAAFLISGAAPVFAQASAGEPATQETTLTPKQAKAQARKEARAKRKAERKEARAKNSADLKRLEDAGYKPGVPDPNYPQNLQNAEKKAAAKDAVPAGASQ